MNPYGKPLVVNNLAIDKRISFQYKKIMKKTSGMVIRFYLFVLFMLLVSPAFAVNNRVKNSSFGEIAADFDFMDWNETGYLVDTGITEFRVDIETAHTGKTSALIINHKPNHSCLKQEIPVEELSIYKFSAWIKTGNIDGNNKGAGISINNLGLMAGDFRGTISKWEYTELYVTTGREVTSVTIVLNLGFFAADNTGKAWFDDINFVKVKDLPVSAEVTVVDPITEKALEANSAKFVDHKEKPFQKVMILVLIGCALALISIALCFLVFQYRRESKKANSNKPVIK